MFSIYLLKLDLKSYYRGEICSLGMKESKMLSELERQSEYHQAMQSSVCRIMLGPTLWQEQNLRGKHIEILLLIKHICSKNFRNCVLYLFLWVFFAFHLSYDNVYCTLQIFCLH